MPNVFQSNNSLSRSVRFLCMILCRRVNEAKSNKCYRKKKLSKHKQKYNLLYLEPIILELIVDMIHQHS